MSNKEYDYNETNYLTNKKNDLMNLIKKRRIINY